MAISTEKLDPIFVINHWGNLLLETFQLEAYSSQALGYEADNLLDGFPHPQWRTQDIPTGQPDFSHVWFDLLHVAPEQRQKLNAVGLVNLVAVPTDTVSGTTSKTYIGLRAAANTNAGSDNLFDGATKFIDNTNPTTRTWVIQLADEHTTGGSWNRYLRVRLAGGNFPGGGFYRWAGIGFVYIGAVYKPPTPKRTTEQLVPSVAIARGGQGRAWSRRIRQARRTFTLHWEDLTTAQKIELEMFAANTGVPFLQDDASTARGRFGTHGVDDFGSPIIYCPHDEGHAASFPTFRNGRYCVIDPSGVRFAYDEQRPEKPWVASMRFFELAA